MCCGLSIDLLDPLTFVLEIRIFQASGGSSPNELQEVEVDYMTNAECCSGTEYTCSQITENMMCARRQGKDSCQGDSGGPIFDTKTRRQVGVVSWGYGCADFDAPGGEEVAVPGTVHHRM